MFRLIFSYFIWHYTQAFRDIFNHIRNFLWFVYHFFSVKVLVKTLFSPWRKLSEQYQKGFNISRLLETFVVNVIMRIVGFFIRLLVIMVGIVALIFVIVAGCISIVLWAVLPFIIILFFVSSLRLLI